MNITPYYSFDQNNLLHPVPLSPIPYHGMADINAIEVINSRY